MRYALMALWLLLCPPALADVSVGVRVAIPGLSIGINMPYYPEMAVVPGYPVYYAPAFDGNYFFYDGMYWVFVDDAWYASYWYNGPWDLVEPEYVPVFILRVPVYYYRRPPVYFRAWVPAEPPHWGERWGHDWEHRHRDWGRWSPGEGPAPAPLPDYQRRYVGENYPHPEEQHVLQQRYYDYRPHDAVVRPQYQRQMQRVNPGQWQRQEREVQGEVRDRPRQRVMPYVPPSALPGTPVGPRGAVSPRQRGDMPGAETPVGPQQPGADDRNGPSPKRESPAPQKKRMPHPEARPQEERAPQQMRAWPNEGRGGDRGGERGDR